MDPAEESSDGRHLEVDSDHITLGEWSTAAGTLPRSGGNTFFRTFFAEDVAAGGDNSIFESLPADDALNHALLDLLASFQSSAGDGKGIPLVHHPVCHRTGR